MATPNGQLLNYIPGGWLESIANEYLQVVNPATIETIGQVPLSPAAEVEQAAQAAADAFVGWRRVPVVDDDGRLRSRFRGLGRFGSGCDQSGRTRRRAWYFRRH